MNLEEDIKIGSVPYFESWYIEIETETEQEAIEKKQQIIQWQRDSEKYQELNSITKTELNEYRRCISENKELSETKAKYDMLVKKIEDHKGRCMELHCVCRELSSLMEN